MADTKESLQASSSNTEDIGPVQNGGAPPPKRKRGIKNHCARFWWVHLIIVIVIALVITLVVIFVAYPKTAQDDVNDSKLNITSMSILNPTPNSYDLTLESKLKTHAAFHPQIFPFTGTTYLGDTDEVLVILPIPKVKATNGAMSNISQHVTLSDPANFTDFSVDLVKNKTVTLKLKGKPKLQQGSLQKVTVNYDKTLTLTGFDSLSGLTITDLTLLLTVQPDGANMAATVHIPNPTVLTLEMGNITVNFAIPANVTGTDSPTAIGTGKMDNVLLKPGSNMFNMRSKTNQTFLIGLITKDPGLAKSGLPTIINTQSAVVNGIEIPYFTKALQTPLTINLDFASALKAAGLGGLLG